MKLSFHYWQPLLPETPVTSENWRGIPLFNDEQGSTISLQTAIKRGEPLELVANTVFVACPRCGIHFIAETPMGFQYTAEPSQAWVFNPERHYEAKLAAEIILRLESLGCPGAKGASISLDLVCSILKKRDILLTPFVFFPPFNR